MQRKSSINLRTGPLCLWLKTKLHLHRMRFQKTPKNIYLEKNKSQGLESGTADQAQPVVWVPTNQSRDILKHWGRSVKTPEGPQFRSRVKIALDKSSPRSALLKL